MSSKLIKKIIDLDKKLNNLCKKFDDIDIIISTLSMRIIYLENIESRKIENKFNIIVDDNDCDENFIVV